MKTLRSLCLLCGLLLAASSVYAHHSVAAQFDPEKMVMAKGILTKVDWINPHTYFTMDVKQPDGALVSMELESAAPAALRRAGVAGREAMKVGTEYTIFYHPARNGDKGIGLLAVFTLPDGRMIGASAQESFDLAVKLVEEEKAKSRK